MVEKQDDNVQNDDQLNSENQHKMLEEELETMGNSIIKTKPIIKSQDAHKEFFAYLSKQGKDLEKNLTKYDNSNIFNYELDHRAQQEGISEYLVSEGYFSADKILREECNQSTREQSDKIMNLRKEVNDMLLELENNNIKGVITWGEAHVSELQNIDSDLLFQAYKLHFLRLVKEGKQDEAIELARKKLSKNMNQNAEEISRLMTSILYMDNQQSSPYSDLYHDDDITTDLKKILERDSKKIVGLPAENPQLTVFKAGVLAQPQFLKFKDIINEKENTHGNDIEIPYAPELDKCFNYHSMIVCPISKEVCSPENNAMMLKCGHIVSEQSIKKMLVSRNKKKFKCPTCPNEQSISQVRKIDY